MSGIVESSFGYHILLRLPLDESAAAEAVRQDYFGSFLSEQVASAQLSTSADYDKLDPQALYEAIQAGQAAQES